MRTCFLFCLLLLLPAGPLAAQPCTTSWAEINGGSWYTTANWDNGVPDATDDACITLAGTYTVTVGDFTVNSLTLGAASGTQTLQCLSGDMNLTTGHIGGNGVLEWSDCVLESGTLLNQGLIHIEGGRVRGATTVLRNEGTVVHESGNFGISVEGRVENATVWDVQGDVSYPGSGISGGGVFVNEVGATFQKTGGTGRAGFVSVGRTFDNFGTIDVQSGELAIGWSSTHTDAVLTTAAGATLHFASDAAAPVSTFNGTITGAQAGLLQMRHPFTAGPNAVWDFTGNGLTWDTASFTAGTLTNQGLVRLGLGSTRGVSGATTVFRNESTVVHEGGKNLQILFGGRVENAALWDVQGDNSFMQGNGSGNTFVNEAGATFQKSAGTGLMRILGFSLGFYNFGTFEVQAGTVQLEVPSSHTSAVLTTAAEATLRLMATTTDGVPETFIGPITGAQAGDLEVAQDFTAGAGAQWTFTGTPVSWEAGRLLAGTLINQTPLRLTSDADKGVEGPTALFRNEAPVVHTAGNFIVGDDGRVEQTAVWDVQGDPDYNGTTGGGTFVNTTDAVFKKTTGTGATVFTGGGFGVENAGTFSVEAGEIDLNRPFDHQDGALVQGTGTFDVLASAFTHGGDTGPGTSPGVLTWEGAYTMGSTATLHIEAVDESGDGTGHDLLAVAGNADVTQGALSVTGTLPCTGTPPCDYTILTFTGTFAGPFAQATVPAGARVVYPTDADGVPGEVFLRVGTVLPVELVRFTATAADEGVHLRWATASETGNAGFSVERRTPDGPWRPLGWVEGRGTTAVPQAYTFTDAAPPYAAPALRYRLKQLDFDGAYAYSPEVEVLRTPPAAFALAQNYPNPFNPRTRIRFALPEAAVVRLAVYDLLGREVARLVDGRTPAGRHDVRFNAAGLPTGVYLYRLHTSDFTQTRHMLLLK